MSRIYVNAGLDDEARAQLSAGTIGHELAWGAPIQTVLDTGAADPELAGATIAFGQPHPAALLSASDLRFVQLTSAGWTRYDSTALRAHLVQRGTVVCSASSVYAEPVAEHATAMILALQRRLPESLEEQHDARRWRFLELRAGSRLLAGETMLFLGCGSIARAMSVRLRPFGVRFIGYRRRARGDEDMPIVDGTGLAAALAQADHVVDLLPESDETRGFVDAALLASFKPGARFYNLGRGATVDQAALRAALLGGRLDAAWLDVTTPEPLPPDDPLWSTPRLYVSPHTAGGHQHETLRQVQHFLGNLAAFERGSPLTDRVI